jgi:hypothetical protein
VPRLRGERVKWAHTLGLEGLLAKHLPLGKFNDPLSGIKTMTREQLREAIESFIAEVPAAVENGVESLNAEGKVASAVKVQEHINTKFAGMECCRGKSETGFTIGNYTVPAPTPAPGTGLAEQALAHISAFLARQDPEHVRRAFDRHARAAAGGRPAIGRNRLRAALEDLGVLVLEDTVDDIFATMDTDGDGVVDLGEFAIAVARPSRVEQWTDGIAVDRLLASALSPVVADRGAGGAAAGGDVLRALSRCSDSEFPRDAPPRPQPRRPGHSRAAPATAAPPRPQPGRPGHSRAAPATAAPPCHCLAPRAPVKSLLVQCRWMAVMGLLPQGSLMPSYSCSGRPGLCEAPLVPPLARPPDSCSPLPQVHARRERGGMLCAGAGHPSSLPPAPPPRPRLNPRD